MSAPTCETLALRKRLSQADSRRARLWHAFGRLIGNSDMHFGNVSLWVDDLAAGRFSLAPCYDMLPMAYKPSPHDSGVGYTSLTPERPTALPSEVWQQARSLALQFWQRASQHAACSQAFRATAREHTVRISALP
jgi:hypothetical protein